MAKPTIERAPALATGNLDSRAFEQYMLTHGITDADGRYLHWHKLKWRLEPRKDAQAIWQVIKLQRLSQSQQLELLGQDVKRFTFCVPHSMEAKLYQITQLTNGPARTMGGETASKGVQTQFLVASLIMEEAITSAQLEGAATTRVVAKHMLECGRDPQNEDERMILNNYLLLKHAEQKCSDNLSIDLILDFHRIATQSTTENNVTPGELRAANDIFVQDKSGEIAYQPPSYEQLPARLAALCQFANSNHSGSHNTVFIHPVIKAIILHFMMGYEHPFRDGNGRTARALFYWFMLKSGYALFKYISISKLLKNDPKEYGLSYMYTETDENDLTYFIDYQLDIILQAIDELKTYLNRRTEEFKQVLELLESSVLATKLNFQQKDIIKKAIKSPGRLFTVAEISSDYGISKNTARNYLNVLSQYKLLIESKDKKTALFIVPNDLKRRLGL